MKKSGILSLIIIIGLAGTGWAQDRRDNLSYVDENRLYILLDQRWTHQKKKEIASLMSLDSALIEMALQDKTLQADSMQWQIRRLDENLVELSKDLSEPATSPDPGDVVLVDDRMFVSPFIINPFLNPAKKYGLNKFGKTESITYADSIAHFFLPGFTEKKQVILSGTFNNWSTTQLPMYRTEKGWQADVRLQPGKYEYKFIADGFWMRDPCNKLKAGDNRSGTNSVLYLPNHTFRLAGHEKAKSVILTGSFNNWHTKELKMMHASQGWQLSIYLPEGTYAYKFIVNGEWITDPGNEHPRADAAGNLNSFIGIGDTVVFRLAGYDTAHMVTIAGSFNNWDGGELVMNKTEGGWSLPVMLGRGYYEYKFIVDGKWMPDPANPMTTGSGEYTNSCFWLKPNHTFRLRGFTDATKVVVTGTFNGWRTDSYTMTLKDGGWEFPIYLKSGKYLYKYIVDGSWMIDPASSDWEDNAEGTGNSVLWIEQETGRQ